MKLTTNVVAKGAHKTIKNDEYVEVCGSSVIPANCHSYIITRGYMGYTQWQTVVHTAIDAVNECASWGLDGWEIGMYGDEA